MCATSARPPWASAIVPHDRQPEAGAVPGPRSVAAREPLERALGEPGGEPLALIADLQLNAVGGTMRPQHDLAAPVAQCVIANTKGKSATFSADPTKRYSVNVHVATLTNGVAAGTIIACGDLKASGKGKPSKPHPAQAKGPKA